MALIEICHTLRQNALLVIQLHELELIIRSWIVKISSRKISPNYYYLYNFVPFS